MAQASLATSVVTKKAVWGQTDARSPYPPTGSCERYAPDRRKSSTPRCWDIRRLLQEKLKPLGDYHMAIVFPNQGGS